MGVRQEMVGDPRNPRHIQGFCTLHDDLMNSLMAVLCRTGPCVSICCSPLGMPNALQCRGSRVFSVSDCLGCCATTLNP